MKGEADLLKAETVSSASTMLKSMCVPLSVVVLVISCGINCRSNLSINLVTNLESGFVVNMSALKSPTIILVENCGIRRSRVGNKSVFL